MCYTSNLNLSQKSKTTRSFMRGTLLTRYKQNCIYTLAPVHLCHLSIILHKSSCSQSRFSVSKNCGNSKAV